MTKVRYEEAKKRTDQDTSSSPQAQAEGDRGDRLRSVPSAASDEWNRQRLTRQQLIIDYLDRTDPLRYQTQHLLDEPCLRGQNHAGYCFYGQRPPLDSTA